MGEEFERLAERLSANQQRGFLQLNLVQLLSYLAVMETASSALDAFLPGTRGTIHPGVRSTQVPTLSLLPDPPLEPTSIFSDLPDPRASVVSTGSPEKKSEDVPFQRSQRISRPKAKAKSVATSKSKKSESKPASNESKSSSDSGESSSSSSESSGSCASEPKRKRKRVQSTGGSHDSSSSSS